MEIISFILWTSLILSNIIYAAVLIYQGINNNRNIEEVSLMLMAGLNILAAVLLISNIE